MGSINLLIFLVLHAMLFIYMFRYSARLKNPLNSNNYLMLEGTEMSMILLLATGTLALSSSGGGHGAGGGFNLQAIRLLVLEITLLFLFFVSSHKPKWGIGTILYLIYMLWLLYSMTYSNAGQYGWRYILKYLYPFLLMLGTSAVVRDEEVFLGACVWIRRVAIITLLGHFPIIGLIIGKITFSIFWYATALTIHYVTVACISLALYFNYGKDWKDLVLGIAFFFPTIINVHRTGLLAIFVGVAVFCFLKFTWKSLPYIFGVLAIGLAIVFYVPSFHDKMFWKDTENELTIQDLREGNISEDDIRNNGRKATWEMLKSEFYYGHELKGSGIGSVQKLLYDLPGVKQAHGDYIQMKCDTGDIGMYLYILVAIGVFVHCLLVVFNPDMPNHIKVCAMIAAGALAGNYAGMYSDNVVTYTMATTGYPFAFYGMMLGLISKHKGEE